MGQNLKYRKSWLNKKFKRCYGWMLLLPFLLWEGQAQAKLDLEKFHLFDHDYNPNGVFTSIGGTSFIGFGATYTPLGYIWQIDASIGYTPFTFIQVELFNYSIQNSFNPWRINWGESFITPVCLILGLSKTTILDNDWLGGWLFHYALGTKLTMPFYLDIPFADIGFLFSTNHYYLGLLFSDAPINFLELVNFSLNFTFYLPE